MNTSTLWIFFTIATSLVCQAYRILVIVPVPSGSHANLGNACVKALLAAGHEVVYVTSMPKRLDPHPKFVEVDISSSVKFFPSNVINLPNLLENNGKLPSPTFFFNQLTNYTAETLKHEAVQRLLTAEKKFDVVIAEWMFTEMYAGLPAVLDCPLIWFSSLEPHALILGLVDEFPNPSYINDFGINSVAPFSFFERVHQLAMRIFMTTFREYHIYFKETKIFKEVYEPLMKKLGKPLPSYEELRYNASLVLSNSHVSLGQATRLPQNFISIGGYHVDLEPKPLSEDVKKIMDNAKNGVIYFSMGSILKSKDFPDKMKMDLLKMFGSLKQTVLWKFEEDFPNLPKNVHILKWASQQSILAHPNCILFISHGGLLSLTESIHYAVPIIGVPAFADQIVNIIRAEKKGFAKPVQLSYDLAKDLNIAVEEVLGNPRYKEKVKEISFVYHSRPTDPRKELVHWVEHVIETQGAPMLRSPALQIPFYQMYYLDLAALVIVLLFVLRRIFNWIISKCKGKSPKKENVKKINEKKRK